MKLDAFIEKFLPNYEERWKKYRHENSSNQDVFLIKSAFFSYHFEEALQNFTSKVCEKQRETCANDVYFYVSMDSNPNPEDLREIINNSFTTSIHEL